MNKEFIPYEQALELKELGFNDLCLFYYGGNEVLRIYHQSEIEEDLIGAPLYQQTFRWFREKYNLDSHIRTYPHPNEPKRYEWHITGLPISFEVDKPSEKIEYFIYEEAELSCLKKLIEIAKKYEEGSKM